MHPQSIHATDYDRQACPKCCKDADAEVIASRAAQRLAVKNARAGVDRNVALNTHMRDCWPDLPPHTIEEHQEIVALAKLVEQPWT